VPPFNQPAAGPDSGNAPRPRGMTVWGVPSG
jgi:hypothetical protein